MALDGIVIYSLIEELSSQLIGGKIDKIYQPEEDEILFTIRNNGKNHKLLLSSNSSNPRIYLTNNYKKENPINAPMFCMILRKYILNGKIVNISQPEFERIIKITIESFDELKTKTTKDLIIEIMGKHSNIILVNNEDNKVLDSIKRINLSISSYRQILPGKTYMNPPSQNKLNPLNEISLDVFKNLLFDKQCNLHKSIYSSFEGVSPLIAKEICFRSNLEENISVNDLENYQFERLFNSFARFFNLIKNKIFHPSIVIDKRIDKIIDFSCVKLTMYNHFSFIENDSMSFILEKYYYEKDVKERIHQKSQDLRKNISNKLDRLYNKLKKQKEELLESNSADIYKTHGELITSYIYMIEKGMDKIDVLNFFDPENKNITISLNKNLTPSENAQKYFKKYSKFKNAAIEISEQINISEEELNYLENIVLSISNCENIEELDEIKEELIKEGYIKGRSSNKNKDKNKDKNKISTQPHEFISSDNFKIYVGKNNKQNDYLTLKIANTEDIWMHTKNIPGSHVIIKTEGREIPDSTLLEGALLAAYFSKGKMSSQVPVDYTKRKNLKKPNGAKPGMVIYETNSTIYVTPAEEDIAKIKNNNSEN